MKFTLGGDGFLTQIKAIVEYQAAGTPNTSGVELPKKQKMDFTRVNAFLKQIRSLGRMNKKLREDYVWLDDFTQERGL